MKVLALGNLGSISEHVQPCEQMMLRGDAHFWLCHHHPKHEQPIGDRSSSGSIAVGADTLVHSARRRPDSAPAGGFAAASRSRSLPIARNQDRAGSSRRGWTANRAFRRSIRCLRRIWLQRCSRWPGAGHGRSVAAARGTLAEDGTCQPGGCGSRRSDLAIPIDIRSVSSGGTSERGGRRGLAAFERS